MSPKMIVSSRRTRMDLMRSRERGSFTSMKFWESIVIRVQWSAAFRVWDPVLGSEWCSEAMTHQLDVDSGHDV